MNVVGTRELDSRTNDGIQVRLLWCEYDRQLCVAVLDTKTGDSFRVEVRHDERPLDVFRHPYAYAAHHDTIARCEFPRPRIAVSIASSRPTSIRSILEESPQHD